MGKKKELMIQAIPELESRPGDVDVPIHLLELYLQIGLLARDPKKPRLSPKQLVMLPSALRLRRFRQGEVICRQGEPGWTAFSILTPEDVRRFFTAYAEKLGPEAGAPYLRELAEWEAGAGERDPECAARVLVAQAAGTEARPASTWGRLLGTARGRPEANVPASIPVDAPRDVNARTRTATIRAGEIFGEMSCLNRTPRSATIVTAHDCYALEMLRTVLEPLKKNADFRKEMQEQYREHVLDRQFLSLPLFRGLDEQPAAVRDAVLDALRRGVELAQFAPGQIICDEHDRADALYIVRVGTVKVMKNVSALLRPEDVRDADAAVGRLREAAGRPALEAGKPLTTDATKSALAAVPPESAVLAEFLNTFIKGPPLWEGAADPAAGGGRFAARYDPAVKALPDLERRRLNRLFLEGLLGDALAELPLPPPGAPEWVINYCGRGDLLGELGLLLDRPVSATCVAASHSQEALAEAGIAPEDNVIECVRLPRATFDELRRQPFILARVEEIARRRQQADVARRDPAAALTNHHLNPRFAELGLIQGQALMVIDLERCTRCDECVKGCVSSHTDGRSRLFLDGPRYGRFLVPVTCRSCRDPVCLIGCPVGSIRRGDKQQIVVEDWCIGCGLCAQNCPYGSIQMHEVGVIGAASQGWRFRADPGEPAKWSRPDYGDARWEVGAAPFGLSPDAQPGLARYARPAGGAGPVGFRLDFTLSREQLRRRFRLDVWSLEKAAVEVWVNGTPLPEVKGEKDRASEFAYPPRFARTYELAAAAAREGDLHRVLRPGRNVLAARVTPPDETAAQRGIFFDARLNAVLAPDLPAADDVEYRLRQVNYRAVVCDLCAELPGQQPACVSACPHDAALRVDAWTQFPSRP